jgi:HPt (histidine-containing phosphotransfer) domain-containing protein
MVPPPTSAPVAPSPTLDAQALARLRELDPDGRAGVVRRVLEAYQGSLRRGLEQLAATPPPAPEAVSALAHTFKSSSASVGALELAQVCSEVERRLKAGEHQGLERDIAHLLEHGRAALQAVGTILQS